MIRLLLVFVLVFVLAVAAATLADHPGMVTFDLGDQEIRTSLAFLVGSFAAFGAVTAGLVALISWLRHELPVVGKQATIRRQGRGLKKLNQALVAMAAGDHVMARRLVAEAEVLLPPQPMLHLLAAEGALRSGDTATARQRFQALEATEDGRFLGLRGLVLTARQLGREAEALRLARAAFEDRPKSPWVLETLFSLEVAAGHWAEAQGVLEKVSRAKLRDAATIARHRGALAYGEATEAALEGDSARARKLYRQALKARPGFAPATAALARLEQAGGNRKAAEKLLLTAWGEAPFPSLRAAYKALDVTESRLDWLKRARALAARQPDHSESIMLVADAALKAGEVDAAASALEALSDMPVTRPYLKLKLDLVAEVGGDRAGLEAQLATAPDGPGWRCGHCGHTPGAWSALCDSCGAFDSMTFEGEARASATPAVARNEAIMLLSDETSAL